MNEIKKTAVNIMVTTGVALVLLSIFGISVGYKYLYHRVILEILGANIIIHLGHMLIRKIESAYVVLEYLLDIVYITTVLIILGTIFDWFLTMPVWYLVVMAVVVYTFTVFTNIIRNRKDVKELNELLQKRKKKNLVAAS